MTGSMQAVTPGLFILPLPTPFPIGRINTYLFTGCPVTLVDTGVNSTRAYQELVSGLSKLGLAVTDLEQVIITHHHTDHIGLVDRLAAESRAEIVCHVACVPYVEDPAAARQRLNNWSMAVWQEGGVPAELLAEMAQVLAGFETLSNGPASVARAVEDGDTVALNDRPWTVLHMPGHAGDLICLHDPDSGILLSSDHLLRDVSSNALAEPPEPGGKRPRRLLQYMDNLRRAAELGARIAYGGHGKPTTDIAGLVEQRLAFHQRRAQHILTLLDDEPIDLFTLTERMFAHVGRAEKFLALSEVLGHIDWLERDGYVVRAASHPVVRWERVNQN